MFQGFTGTIFRSTVKVLPFALAVALLPVENAMAGHGSGICWDVRVRKNVPCGHSSSPRRPRPTRPRGPTPQQIERKRAVSFYDASEKGYRAYERKDWATAIHYFKAALSYAPHNPTMNHNLRRARQKQAQAIAAAKRQREQAAARRRAQAAAERRAQAAGERRRKAAAFRKVLEEARAAKAHAEAAKSKGDEGRKEAQKIFDTRGKRVSSSTDVVDVRGLGRAVDIPAEVEIPAALANRPEIRRLQKERKTFVKQIKKLETKLNSIREKKASGKGNKGQLEVEEVKTKDEISKTKSKIAVADLKMKSFVITLTREKSPSKKPEKKR